MFDRSTFICLTISGYRGPAKGSIVIQLKPGDQHGVEVWSKIRFHGTTDEMRWQTLNAIDLKLVLYVMAMERTNMLTIQLNQYNKLYILINKEN